MAAPLGQSVPSLGGLRASPSMLAILPLTVCTSVAQPTEQYGQMLGYVLASLIRNSAAAASVGARSAPSPARPPRAAPPAPAETRMKLRRERSIPHHLWVQGTPGRKCNADETLAVLCGSRPGLIS